MNDVRQRRRYTCRRCGKRTITRPGKFKCPDCGCALAKRKTEEYSARKTTKSREWAARQKKGKAQIKHLYKNIVCPNCNGGRVYNNGNFHENKDKKCLDCGHEWVQIIPTRKTRHLHCGENCQAFVQHPQFEFHATCTDLNKTVCKNERCKKYDNNGEPVKDLTGEPIKRQLLF